MRPTALFRLYQALSFAALPFVARNAVSKLRKAGITVDRAHERLGHPTAKRHLGQLMWFHAASVGEAKSVLPLIKHLDARDPDLYILFTTGTATSLTAIKPHLPPSVVHQFSPLDGTGPIKRFLDHWRPNLAVLVESELWPNMLDACARRNIPVAVVNARLSDQSAQGWLRFPSTTRYVLRGVRMAQCQDKRSQAHLREMGLTFAKQGPNLKAIATAAKADPASVGRVLEILAGRPVWVAASTHKGEEEGILAAHAALLETIPNLCLILAPRHPERAQDIMKLIKSAHLSVAQRSVGDALEYRTQVYLADTIGETPLWYAISPIVFLGGSWSDAGGHNPFEPANAHCAIIHGNKYQNFSETYTTFLTKGASIEVENSAALTDAVAHLLSHPSRAAQLAASARPLAQSMDETLKVISDRLHSLCEP